MPELAATPHGLGLPLSPELVLVMPPESAEIVRRQLPDRPWEAFVPPVRLAVAPMPVRAATTPARTGFRPARRTAGVLAVLVGAGAFLVLPAREATNRPTLVGPTLAAPASGGTERFVAPRASGGARPSVTPTTPHRASRGAPASSSTTHSVTRASRSVRPKPASTPANPWTKPPRNRPAARSSLLGELTAATGTIRGGGYVFDEGHFRVARDGRSLIDFSLVRCAGVALPRIPIRSDGSFAYTRGKGVRVEGRFATPQSVRGTLRIELRGCRLGRTGFSAHLS